MPGEAPAIIDRINFVHDSNTDLRSGTKILNKRMMLEAGQSYQVLAHTYSYGDVNIDGFANSQVYAKVKEVNVRFISGTDIPEFPIVVLL